MAKNKPEISASVCFCKYFALSKYFVLAYEVIWLSITKEDGAGCDEANS